MTTLAQETPQHLAGILREYWEIISENSGMPTRQIGEQALLSPARCCLKNIGQVGAETDARAVASLPARDVTIEHEVVETAFDCLKKVSRILIQELGL